MRFFLFCRMANSCAIITRKHYIAPHVFMEASSMIKKATEEISTPTVQPIAWWAIFVFSFSVAALVFELRYYLFEFFEFSAGIAALGEAMFFWLMTNTILAIGGFIIAILPAEISRKLSATLLVIFSDLILSFIFIESVRIEPATALKEFFGSFSLFYGISFIIGLGIYWLLSGGGYSYQVLHWPALRRIFLGFSLLMLLVILYGMFLIMRQTSIDFGSIEGRADRCLRLGQNKHNEEEAECFQRISRDYGTVFVADFCTSRIEHRDNLSREYCFASVALVQKDFSLCERISSLPCAKNIFTAYNYTETVCEQISDPAARGLCIQAFILVDANAMVAKSIDEKIQNIQWKFSLCGSIPSLSPGSNTQRKDCYALVGSEASKHVSLDYALQICQQILEDNGFSLQDNGWDAFSCYERIRPQSRRNIDAWCKKIPEEISQLDPYCAIRKK